MTTTESSDECQCCAGAVEMDVEPCTGCLDAIMRQDRDGHPHELSQAQRALRDEDVVGGKIEMVVRPLTPEEWAQLPKTI